MYCIRKFADCWAVINLENDQSRQLTDEEVGVIREEVPSLNDPQVAAYYTDRVDCIMNKP